MTNEFRALQKKAELHRREMQEAHTRRAREAATEIALQRDAKAAEVHDLASLLKSDKPIPAVHQSNGPHGT